MYSQNIPLDHMRSVVAAYDRLSDDPQALGLFLALKEIDHHVVVYYRRTLCDATPSRRRRTPARCPLH